LNESWTNLKRNDQLAGYRSIITTNAEDPTDDNGKPIPWTFGPARVQSLQGVIARGDEANPEAIATPGVIVVDPVNPLESSIPTITTLVEAILEQLDQLWTRSSSQNVSGESKRESRKAFDKRVIETAGGLVRALQWALETALALAATVNNRRDPYARYRINPKLFLDVERGNLELFKALLTGYERNVVSLEALVLANPGVEDAAAELQRLHAPARLTPALADAAIASGRLSRQAALENGGYAPEDATRIVAQSLEEAQMLQGGVASNGGDDPLPGEQ
ncbi:MAG: hypothetical protein HC933_17575, partial [Pleurocapsa sp. SU_196_0]|nr:hypothetical protein [Pleurocapsa sp. SU_196_0]